MTISLDFILFGFLWLLCLAWFLALNYVAWQTYAGFISSKVIAIVPLLWALLWQLVSLLPLALAIMCHERAGVSVPL